METIFKELAIGDTFTMKVSDFDLGKVYRKMGNRVYSQIDSTGGLQGGRIVVGSIKAKVFKL